HRTSVDDMEPPHLSSHGLAHQESRPGSANLARSPTDAPTKHVDHRRSVRPLLCGPRGCLERCSERDHHMLDQIDLRRVRDTVHSVTWAKMARAVARRYIATLLAVGAVGLLMGLVTVARGGK